MKIEDRIEVRLPAVVKPAEIERERGSEHEEDEDEHVRERCREIAGKLAPQDNADVAHGASGGNGAKHIVELGAGYSGAQAIRGVIGDDPAARDDDGARTDRVDLLEDVRRDDDN